jgi:shikimate dehydrogenase
VDYAVSSLDETDMNRHGEGADLLVNTTSVGMNGTNFEYDFLESCAKCLVYDMVYTPAETPLLAAARKLGLRCANGAGMLVSQGEAAFRLWTGIEPPPGVMRDALFRKLEQTTKS